MSNRRCRVNGRLVEEIGETAYQLFDSVPAGQSPNQDQVGITMVKALRRWLEANELFAIVTGVVGALVVLAMLLVFGGYLFVTR
jgi:hypothetical protein